MFGFSAFNGGFQAFILVLLNFPAVRTNQMIMKVIVIRSFVNGYIFTELVFKHQIAIQKKLYGVV
jgi:hypothetical protein